MQITLLSEYVKPTKELLKCLQAPSAVNPTTSLHDRHNQLVLTPLRSEHFFLVTCFPGL